MQFTDEQLAKIIAWAKKTPEVQAVFVTGSRANGTASPNTGVDLALSMTGADALRNLATFISHRRAWRAELEAALGLAVQLVGEEWAGCIGPRDRPLHQTRERAGKCSRPESSGDRRAGGWGALPLQRAGGRHGIDPPRRTDPCRTYRGVTDPDHPTHETAEQSETRQPALNYVGTKEPAALLPTTPIPWGPPNHPDCHGARTRPRELSRSAAVVWLGWEF